MATPNEPKLILVKLLVKSKEQYYDSWNRRYYPTGADDGAECIYCKATLSENQDCFVDWDYPTKHICMKHIEVVSLPELFSARNVQPPQQVEITEQDMRDVPGVVYSADSTAVDQMCDRCGDVLEGRYYALDGSHYCPSCVTFITL